MHHFYPLSLFTHLDFKERKFGSVGKEGSYHVPWTCLRSEQFGKVDMGDVSKLLNSAGNVPGSGCH